MKKKYKQVRNSVEAARLRKYERVRVFFAKNIEKNLDYDYVIDLCVDEFGYSHGTVEKIVNRYGYYKDK